MHIFITNEIVYKIPFPTLHMVPQWHSQNVEGCITKTRREMFHLCSGCLRKSFGVETRGRKPSDCSFALNVLLLPQKPVRLKAMVWVTKPLHPPSFLQSLSQTFCSRQSRHQLLDAWNDNSQWNGHWQAEGRSCGQRKGLCYSGQAVRNPAPGSRQHWQRPVFTHHS